jgi:hypothetical protein
LGNLAGHNTEDHFVLGYKMIEIGKGGMREVASYHLAGHNIGDHFRGAAKVVDIGSG